MKKLVLSVVIASTLGLTACGGKNSNEHKNDAVASVPQVYLDFNPDPNAPDTVIPLPGDLLFSGTTDGTLMVPGKETGNFSDPSIALGALDGWSTTEPITLPVKFPKYDSQQKPISEADLGILPMSVEQEGVARVFEVQKSGPLAFDNNCKTASAADALKVCRIEKELKYGEDFTTQVLGRKIAIVPLKPLKENQSYLYVTTDKIQDTLNRPIAGSSTFNILKTNNALPSQSQRDLQAIVHNYQDKLNEQGVDPKTITYASMFTTQSISNVLEVTKAKMAADFAAIYSPSASNPQPNVCQIKDEMKAAHPYAPTFDCTSFKQEFNSDGTPKTAYDALQLNNPSLQPLYDNALIYSVNIRLPIFNSCSSIKCTTTNGRWTARGDSPIIVQGALRSGKLTQEEFVKQTVAQGVNPEDALTDPSKLVGLSYTIKDVEGNSVPLDPNKFLTRYNPLPNIVGYETTKVQITIPKDEGENANQIPDTGFPVVIGMHAISALRQMSYAFSGSFSLIKENSRAPLATVTIDMPLHGERSFRKDPNDDMGAYDVTATSKDSAKALGVENAETLYAKGTTLAFVNVGSPLTIRGNFRQAIMDQLSVRLLLNVMSPFMKQALPKWRQNDSLAQVLDTSKVTAQGLSLGALMATDFAAYANSGVINPATGKPAQSNPYKIAALSIESPTGGLSGSFAGSNRFGPLLYSEIQKQPSFIEALNEAANGGEITDQLRQAVYAAFIPDFGFAVQSVIDSIDPINYAARVKTLNIPTHLIEVVGNGEPTNPSDRVLGNNFAGLPIIDSKGKPQTLPLDWFKLSGTDPLITVMGLSCVDGSADTPPASGAVRFVKGAHDSFVDPDNPFNSTIGDGDFQGVLLEMQSQAGNFLQSASYGTPQVLVSQPDLVTCK